MLLYIFLRKKCNFFCIYKKKAVPLQTISLKMSVFDEKKHSPCDASKPSAGHVRMQLYIV